MINVNKTSSYGCTACKIVEKIISTITTTKNIIPALLTNSILPSPYKYNLIKFHHNVNFHFFNNNLNTISYKTSS